MTRTLRTVAAALAAATVLTSGLLAVAAPASAAAPTQISAKRPPIPVAGVSGAPSPRLDQDTTQTVTAVGASREAAVSVTWGDGSARSIERSTCSAARAVATPGSCTVSMRHIYRDAGSFPVVVRSGARIIARTTIVIREAARPWSPPAGWVQPANWATFSGGATYIPCSTVRWYYDKSAEPVTAVGMRAEVQGALALLAVETGLVFVEVADPSQARLSYSWADLSSNYGSAAGVGGRRGQNGYVRFSTTDWWPTDQWPGYGTVVQPDGSSALGRGWLVVHETMHALGMAHVNDPTQIMNPIAGDASALGAGDLDGLHTMYLNNPCPV